MTRSSLQAPVRWPLQQQQLLLPDVPDCPTDVGGAGTPRMLQATTAADLSGIFIQLLFPFAIRLSRRSPAAIKEERRQCLASPRTTLSC